MCYSLDVYWWRQIFVLIVACLHSFCSGVMVAFPSILNPAILSVNSTDIRATSDEASWVASINGISGVAGFLIFTPIFQNLGRKAANIGINAVSVVGWITLSFANSVAMLLIARAVQGLSVGGVFICAVTLSEYSSPTRRGYFVTFKKVSMALGSLSCHSLALFYTWRQVTCVCVILGTVVVILIFFWTESPAFLALKGRLNECEEAFLWLNGNSTECKKELKDLLSQLENFRKERKLKSSHLNRFLTILNKKEVLKTCLIAALTSLCIDACGRFFLLAYITQILEEITHCKLLAMYCSVLSDLLLISALTISCVVIRVFNRRTVLFCCGSITVTIMFVISISKVLFSQVSWLIPSLILLHSFIAHIGLVPVALTISSEVFPLEYKGLCSFISGIAFTIFYAATLKLTPYMINRTGVSGTYAINALIVALCLAMLFVILPETKDKTLQEIENEIKGTNKTDVDKSLLS